MKERDEHQSTLLHHLETLKDPEMLKRVFNMHPENMHVRNFQGYSPFHLALEYDPAVELMQWHLTFDEIVDIAIDNRLRKLTRSKNVTMDRSQVPRLAPFRFKAVIEAQCENLQALLNRDVAPLVLDFLGFEPLMQKRKRLAHMPMSETSSESESDSDGLDSEEELLRSLEPTEAKTTAEVLEKTHTALKNARASTTRKSSGLRFP